MICLNRNLFERLLGFTGLLALTSWFFYENYTLETTEYDICSENLPDEFEGYRICHLSDLHNRSFGYNSRNIIRRVNKINPDIVVMTGDMVSRQDYNFRGFYNLAKAVAKEYPTYYIIGNHELDLTDRQLSELFSVLRGYNVQVLLNDKVSVEKKGKFIDLYGMYCGLHFYKDEKGNYRYPQPFTNNDLKMLIGERNKNRFTLLLAHNPLFLDVYAKWKADVVLCGHMHGGALRLGRLGGIFAPGKRLFPKYYQGVYKKGKTQMVLSRGLGSLRLFNRPEIVVVNLFKEK